MAMQSAISEPMKFKVVDGIFWVTVTGVRLKEDESEISPIHQGNGDSWRAAKHDFWESFKSDHPGIFLTVPDKRK